MRPFKTQVYYQIDKQLVDQSVKYVPIDNLVRQQVLWPISRQVDWRVRQQIKEWIGSQFT